MVLAETAYQSYCHGIGVVLSRKKKDIWPDVPLTIRVYKVMTAPEANKYGEYIQSFHLGEERFKRYEPKDVALNCMCTSNVPWNYTHNLITAEDPGMLEY